MKRCVLLVFMLIAGASSHAPRALAQQGASSENPLVGAWELVSQTTSEGTVADTLMRDQLKLLTPTHYAVVVQVEEGDSLGVAHAGTYTLEGDTYTETHQYATYPGGIGQEPSAFRWRLEGDEWQLTCEACEPQWTQTWRRVE